MTTLTKLGKGDIIKLSKDEKVTLGKVVDSTEDSVLVFRSGGDVWYSRDEYQVEVLEVAQS